MEELLSYLDGKLRYDRTRSEIDEIYSMPLPKLLWIAQGVHQKYHPDASVQMSSLLSIKTGGCKENCSYCPQSAHHNAKVDAHGLLKIDEVVSAAKKAKRAGATRFCMGAAWTRPPKSGPAKDALIKTAEEVKKVGMEVCMTLGMLDQDQAFELRDAGVDYYNHNLDTSPEYYEKIITTRKYQERLDTLSHVREAGMHVCTGGIVGMGEEKEDRLGLLEQLSALEPHPESVPINMLVAVEGTPLEDQNKLDIFEMVRMVATARIIMPHSQVRLSAGRTTMTDEGQALCFMAGANSIFAGDKLLTTPNPTFDSDRTLLDRLGLGLQV